MTKELGFMPSSILSFVYSLSLGVETSVTNLAATNLETPKLLNAIIFNKELAFNPTATIVLVSLANAAKDLKITVVELLEAVYLSGTVETVFQVITTIESVLALAAISFILAIAALAIALTKRD
jgi:hypothetical protein